MHARHLSIQHFFLDDGHHCKESLEADPKSLVQEEAQEKVGVTPSYKVIAEVGPDHDKWFTVGIFFGEKKIAEEKDVVSKKHSKQPHKPQSN